jgi:hypothetical protein
MRVLIPGCRRRNSRLDYPPSISPLNGSLTIPERTCEPSSDGLPAIRIYRHGFRAYWPSTRGSVKPWHGRPRAATQDKPNGERRHGRLFGRRIPPCWRDGRDSDGTDWLEPDHSTAKWPRPREISANLAACLIGSIPISRHHADSSPRWWTPRFDCAEWWTGSQRLTAQSSPAFNPRAFGCGEHVRWWAITGVTRQPGMQHGRLLIHSRCRLERTLTVRKRGVTSLTAAVSVGVAIFRCPP